MDEVKHVSFSPIAGYGYSPLGTICSNLETEGWMLYRIIPHQQFESIAIFVKVAVPVVEEKEEETKEGGYI